MEALLVTDVTYSTLTTYIAHIRILSAVLKLWPEMLGVIIESHLVRVAYLGVALDIGLH